VSCRPTSGAVTGLSRKGDHRRPRKDLETLDLGQFCDDVLGHAPSRKYSSSSAPPRFSSSSTATEVAACPAGEAAPVSNGAGACGVRHAAAAIVGNARSVLGQGGRDDVPEAPQGSARRPDLRAPARDSGSRRRQAPPCFPRMLTAGCHLMKDDAEREDVGARVDHLAPVPASRRHVGDRAHRRAGLRQLETSCESPPGSSPPRGNRRRCEASRGRNPGSGLAALCSP